MLEKQEDITRVRARNALKVSLYRLTWIPLKRAQADRVTFRLNRSC